MMSSSMKLGPVSHFRTIPFMSLMFSWLLTTSKDTVMLTDMSWLVNFASSVKTVWIELSCSKISVHMSVANCSVSCLLCAISFWTACNCLVLDVGFSEEFCMQFSNASLNLHLLRRWTPWGSIWKPAEHDPRLNLIVWATQGMSFPHCHSVDCLYHLLDALITGGLTSHSYVNLYGTQLIGILHTTTCLCILLWWLLCWLCRTHKQSCCSLKTKTVHRKESRRI